MANMLIGSAGVIFQRVKGKDHWFIMKQGEDGSDWGIPKTTARKGESSVRAIVRYTVDFGGLDIQILEEVTRTGGTTNVGGRVVPLRTLFYLIVQKKDSDIKFPDYDFLELSKATKKVKAKKEIAVLKEAAALLKKLEKEKGKDYWVKVE